MNKYEPMDGLLLMEKQSQGQQGARILQGKVLPEVGRGARV